MLLCTGFLSYSGPFNQEFRDKLITLWQKEMCERKIPYSQDLNLISMLVDTTTVRYILLHGIFCFACDYDNSFSFTLLPCACPHHNLYRGYGKKHFKTMAYLLSGKLDLNRVNGFLPTCF